VACALSGLLGFSRLKIDDDFRHQQALAGDLRSEEAKIRRLTGISDGTEFLMVQASDIEAALQAEEALSDRLNVAKHDGALHDYEAIAQFVPSIKRQREDAQLVRERLMTPFRADLYRRIGLNGGIAPDVNANAFLTPGMITAASPLAFLRSLTLESGPLGATMVILLNGVKRPDELRAVAATVPGVHFADPAGELTSVLTEYRGRAMLLIAVSALLMMPLLIWHYGWRGSLLTMLPSALAVGMAPLLAALAGVTFTFFGALALVLVLSIGFDYAVFCREASPERRPATMIGVWLAMMATLLSFGLLAFSDTFAIHAFGVTLLAGTIIAFLLSPLASDRAKRS
jgi:predicted exporter